ncbi:MAG TPA: MBL fold metallo-hydrolase, partial [Bacteroidetes bacterium]|nr:MBL fold metallo-hydrolase [Bacteroidota bacterium]
MIHKIIVMLFAGIFMHTASPQTYEEDMFPTSQGPLKITFIGHGTLMFTWNGLV